MATKHTALPWTMRKGMMNRWWMLHSTTDECIVANQLSRIDCEYILRLIAARERIKNENAALRKRLHDAESTVKRLRAYVRQNELKTLHGMQVTQHEPI
jgi:hypothetical protein